MLRKLQTACWLGAALLTFTWGAAARPAADAQPRYAKFEGMKLHYRSHGEGRQAIVFVHGWTCDLESWRYQTAASFGGARLIALDLPGHGKSDKPQIAYTMDLFARAVDAVLKDAGVERAVLVGHSMGTPVARQYYRRYPEKTLALVIVDGGLRPFAPKEELLKFTEPLRGPNYQQALTAMFGQMSAVMTPENKKQIMDTSLATPQYVALSAMDGMMDEALWREDKINVPVLAVLAKSPFWPPDNEQFFRGLAPRLDYQMWEGVSHFLMMDKPEAFNTALRAFLEKYAPLGRRKG